MLTICFFYIKRTIKFYLIIFSINMLTIKKIFLYITISAATLFVFINSLSVGKSENLLAKKRLLSMMISQFIIINLGRAKNLF
jgi:hypothetical protein